ncbi:MAG: hypothetical protein ACI8Z7_000138 [Candidatus Nanohaloarchaea archaeon]|jgi:hypothetical protein
MIPDFSDSIGKRQLAVLIGLSFVSVAVILVSVRGFVMFEASSTCQETAKICHGVPYENTCIGLESKESEIVEKSQCGSVDQIEQKCAELGDEICSINENSIGTEWSSETLVFGRTCREWGQNYNISLRSC